jgi:PAS domain S-box-containing protein
MDTPERRIGSREFDDSPHLMAVVSHDGVLKVINAAWSRTLGYRPDELVGRKLLKLVDDPDRSSVLRLTNSRLEVSAASPIEIALHCKDGSYRAFKWESRRVAGEPAIFITGKDVTDQRKLEVTQSLKLYEVYAEAARRKKPTESSG